MSDDEKKVLVIDDSKLDEEWDEIMAGVKKLLEEKRAAAIQLPDKKSGKQPARKVPAD